MPGKKQEIKVPFLNMGSTYGKEEEEAVLSAMRDSTMSMTPFTTYPFEEEFARYAGVKHALATSSCTTALHMATQLIGIGPGDEVIVPPITFIATSQPVLKLGGTVVFADVDPRTFNLDPESAAEKITPKTKAIYVVHYAGQPADMDPIMELARKHGLRVVEDAAHAPGAEYKGRKIGSIADFTCFSFHTQKNMTTLGEGGMLTTHDDRTAREIMTLRMMGFEAIKGQEKYWEPYLYEIVDVRGQIGNNYRMSIPQAAVGSAQLKKLDGFNEQRRRAASYLTERLSQLDEITPPYEQPGVKHVYHLYPIPFDGRKLGATRNDFLQVLYEEEGIEGSLHYWPNYLHEIYRKRGYKPGLCPVAEDVHSRLVTLPIHPTYGEKELDTIVAGVKSAVHKLKAR